MRPVAKAKRKAEEAHADDEAIKEFEERQLKTVVKVESVEKPRNEVSTKEVVGIMADEIQLMYEEGGVEIDEMNARDKALILWRSILVGNVARARDQAVPHVLCKDHE
jgi:arginyl-tRNA synthetase